MVEIASESADIEREVAKLCELLVQYGGFVDERLTFKEVGGNLSIFAPPEIANGTRILLVPHNALLFMDMFDVAVEGSDFVLRDVKPEVSDAQRSLMDSMLRIYNLCGKVDDFKKYATVNLLHHDRQLLERLTNKASAEALASQDSVAFLSSGFFRTRTLGAKVAGSSASRPALMPVIDFLNHNITAGNFAMRDEALQVARSSRVQGTTECFVRYGQYDALDLLNTYGYVDESPCFVYARPMTVDLLGLGEISVKLQNRKFINKKLPGSLKDLQPIFPPFSRIEGSNTMAAGFFRIPQPESPRALRRIIRAITGTLTAGNFPANTTEIMDHAEREIVEGTRQYYQDLKDDMTAYDASPEAAPVIDNVRRMAEVQLGHLSKYDYEKARMPLRGRG